MSERVLVVVLMGQRIWQKHLKIVVMRKMLNVYFSQVANIEREARHQGKDAIAMYGMLLKTNNIDICKFPLL